MSALDCDLEKIRKSERVPALAAAAYINGEVREIAAVGLRKLGDKEPVRIDDKWHIGSCTKPMTATLAGTLVEHGQLDWNTTIEEIFQSWRLEMHSDWHRVTLEQLLSHHGGAPVDAPELLWRRAWEKSGTPTEQRTEFVRGLLLQAPQLVPNAEFRYSNQGYSIAGLMLEHCTKQDWESLIGAKVFRALGMSSAGFGAPGTSGTTDQPRGHALIKNRLEPVEPGPQADNPPAIGPAGIVHCSIADLLKFAASHAGATSLVSENTLRRLHRPYAASDYGLGWIVVHRDWSAGNALNHAGTNMMWYAIMWVAPAKKAAFVAATNGAGPAGEQACNRACERMIMRLLA